MKFRFKFNDLMYDVLFVLPLIKLKNRFSIKILQNRLIFTDLCSSDHLPEVEIFSLLEEQIPKYKLRADTLTQFTGYQNEVSHSKSFIGYPFDTT